jgi:hypothetical protein
MIYYSSISFVYVFFNLFYNSFSNKFNNNLFRFQNRLFKIAFLHDVKKSLIFQKLILSSSSSRFLAIYEVTQKSIFKKVAGVDNKIFLTLSEKFQLNEFLKINYNNWYFQNIKNISFVQKNREVKSLNILTISDRVWQMLISFIIVPSHEAVFHLRNLGYRDGISIHLLQYLISLNVSKKSFGYQKRIISFKLKNTFLNFIPQILLSKLLVPRGIKIGISRSFKVGFLPSFDKDFSFLSYIFANILLNGIEKCHSCVRFGADVLLFLKPFDNEIFILEKFHLFLVYRSLNNNFDFIKVVKVSNSFDFLVWHFYINKKFDAFSFPSFRNYQIFIRRIKTIINNSNYGSKVKIVKIFPLVQEWRIYHKYSIITNRFFSLSKIYEESFKIFSKESSQDFYSVKKLLDKLFNFSKFKNLKRESNYLLYYHHITFCQNFIFNEKKFFFCICCGGKV